MISRLNSAFRFVKAKTMLIISLSTIGTLDRVIYHAYLVRSEVKSGTALGN